MPVTIDGTNGITNGGGYTGDGVSFADATPANTLVTTTGGGVGIGTGSPSAKLDVRGSNIVDGNNGGIISLYSTTAQAADVGSKIDLGGLYDGSNFLSFASVAGRKENSTSGNWSGYLQLSTRQFGGSFIERMRITSAGDVGIGTTVPAARLDVRCAAGGTSIYATDATNSTLSIKHQTGSLLTYETAGVAIQRWVLNGAERMRVTDVGAFLVGTTSQLATNVFSEIKHTTADSWPLALNGNNRGLLVRNSSATSGFYAYFEYNGGTANGSISWSGGTTAFNTTSDARIKENIVAAPEAGSLIDAIQVRSWDFKADGAHWRYGMVAQELLPVVPEAVSVPEDPEMMMGVDYSKLVPVLVKEIQSLRARLAAVEGAIA